MNVFERWHQVVRLGRAVLMLPSLPRAQLHFYSHISPNKIHATHALFNRPHARFPLIKNKTMGIALIDLSNFNSPKDYLATVKRKDYAGHHAKQAIKRGYSVRRINRNNHIDEIYQINRSATVRQGRPMEKHYLILQSEYDESAPIQCFGVFNAKDELCGYCTFGIYGNFAATDRVLGYKNNEGSMYLLFSEIIGTLIIYGNLKYFMYDTYLGAKPGLQSFKRRIGFQPYRVSYAID
jgi:hypothetical protein